MNHEAYDDIYTYVYVDTWHYYKLYFQILGNVLLELTTALNYVRNRMEDTSVTV